MQTFSFRKIFSKWAIAFAMVAASFTPGRTAAMDATTVCGITLGVISCVGGCAAWYFNRKREAVIKTYLESHIGISNELKTALASLYRSKGADPNLMLALKERHPPYILDYLINEAHQLGTQNFGKDWRRVLARVTSPKPQPPAPTAPADQPTSTAAQ